MAGEADNVSSVSASACHIGGPNSVNPGQILLVYGTNEEVNFRNALLLRFVFLLVEVGLIDKCHLSYKQKLLGTEEYE